MASYRATRAQASRKTDRLFPLTLHARDVSAVLLRGLQRFYTQRKFVDVRIVYNGEELAVCHRVVLAIFSPLLESLFIQRSDDDSLATLNVSAIPAEQARHFKTVLQYLYGYTVTTSPATAGELLELARFLQVVPLAKSLHAEMEIAEQKIDNRSMKIVLKPVVVASILVVGFQRFVRDSVFLDTSVVAHGVELVGRRHRLVLAAFSDYFEVLLDAAPVGATQIRLDVLDARAVEHLAVLVDYMYGRALTFLNEEGVRVTLDAARVFGIAHLESELSRLLVKIGDAREPEFPSEPTKVIEFDDIPLDFPRQSVPSPALFFEFGAEEEVVASTSAIDTPSTSRRDESAMQGIIDDGPMIVGNVIDCRTSYNESILIGSYIEAPTKKIEPERPFRSPSPEFSYTMSMDMTDRSAPPVDEMPPLFSPPPTPMREEPHRPTTLDQLTPCALCGRVVLGGRDDVIMRTHVAKHRPIDETISCADCEAMFATKAELLEHSRATHFDERDRASCLRCAIAFATVGAAAEHAVRCDVTNRLEVSTSKKVEKRQKLNKSIGKKPKKKAVDQKSATGALLDAERVCMLCTPPKDFGRKQALLRHERTVHAEAQTVFACEKCPKLFRTAQGRKRHADVEHSGKRRQRCQQCTFSTRSRVHLDTHMRKVHQVTLDGKSVNLLQVCELCGERFAFSCQLRAHTIVKHSKERPFACPLCDYATTEKGALKTHVRGVHKRERLFVCEFCAKRFTTQSILARHRRTHLDYQPHACDACGECFTEKRNLTAHKLKVHEQVRPYRCDRCPSAFFRKDALLSHKRRHGTLPWTPPAGTD